MSKFTFQFFQLPALRCNTPSRDYATGFRTSQVLFILENECLNGPYPIQIYTRSVFSKHFRKLNSPTAVFELVTDDGLKYVALSRTQLCELFGTLQDIQKELDNILQ